MCKAFPALLAFLMLAACSAQHSVQQSVTAPAAHRFTLTDQDGSKRTIGQPGVPVALYFGFTHCKDICPQTMIKLNRARRIAALSPQQLPIVMVTVDPARDTPAVSKRFLARIGVQAAVLSGPPSRLRGVYREYGVFVQGTRNGDVGHTDYIYLINHAARIANVVSPDIAANQLARDMKAL